MLFECKRLQRVEELYKIIWSFRSAKVIMLESFRFDHLRLILCSIHSFLKIRFNQKNKFYARPAGKLPSFYFQDLNFLRSEWQLTTIYSQFFFHFIVLPFFSTLFIFITYQKLVFTHFSALFHSTFSHFHPLNRFVQTRACFSYFSSMNVKYPMCRKKLR